MQPPVNTWNDLWSSALLVPSQPIFVPSRWWQNEPSRQMKPYVWSSWALEALLLAFGFCHFNKAHGRSFSTWLCSQRAFRTFCLAMTETNLLNFRKSVEMCQHPFVQIQPSKGKVLHSRIHISCAAHSHSCNLWFGRPHSPASAHRRPWLP